MDGEDWMMAEVSSVAGADTRHSTYFELHALISSHDGWMDGWTDGY